MQFLGVVLGTATLPSACRNFIASTEPPAPSPTPYPPSPTAETAIPTFIPPTLEATIAPTLTVEQRFMIGQFNAANDPFNARFSKDLNAFLGFIEASNRTLTADIPLPIKGPEFGTEEQYDIFEKARYFNFNGNPYFVITTDRPNHLFFYFHSITSNSVGEIPRKITSFQILNPEKSSQIVDHQIVVNLGQQEYVGQIVDTKILDTQFFSNLDEGSPWGVYPDRDNILFAQTDEFGIPDAIRNDTAPGVFYMTLVSCQSESGRVSNFYSDNIKKRAMVTVKIQLP